MKICYVEKDLGGWLIITKRPKNILGRLFLKKRFFGIKGEWYANRIFGKKVTNKKTIKFLDKLFTASSLWMGVPVNYMHAQIIRELVEERKVLTYAKRVKVST